MAAKLLKLQSAIREYGIPRTSVEMAVAEGSVSIYRFRNTDRYVKRAEFERWIESKKIVQPRRIFEVNYDEI
jgi:hypothetical protein